MDSHFELRKLRDQLRLRSTNRQFQVRNSAIYARNFRSDSWMKCEDSIDDDIDWLWELLDNTTGQTSDDA